MLPDTSRAKIEHRVIISGCDDRTEVTIDLTETELAGIQRLAAATATASDGACQPVLRVVS